MNGIKGKLAVVAALGLGICLGAGALTWSQGDDPLGASGPPLQTAEDLSRAFRDVARDVLPAVVSIEMYTGGTTPERAESDGKEPLSPEDEFFRRFFGDDPRFEEFFRDRDGFDLPEFMPPQEGRGSGFIIDADGIIMTNSHVVESADRVVVHFYDGRVIEADSWVSDPRSDVAIVRVSVDEPLPTVELGDSSAMQVGDWVLAMGNPFNVGVTVTAGIISATGRAPHINERESYLQTDAAINPGNSGGPLVNLNGRVVGINTAISTSSGGYDGVGFAIPVNMARWVAEQLIETGTVRRAFLGVQLQELTAELRRQFGVDPGRGALISQVGPDTPAAEAGFQPGDIVLEFAGEAIENRSELQGVVEVLEIGEEYTAVVWRNGREVELDVTLAEMPADYTAALRRGRKEEPRKDEEEATSFDQLGLELDDLTPETAEQFGLDKGEEGVVVTSVQRGSPAASAGVQPGDVIERVGSTDVSTVAEFAQATEEADLEQGVVLLLRRGEGTHFVVLKNGR